MNKRFPLFVDLTGRLVTVVGGGKVALRRARVLQDFGARVEIISPEVFGDSAGAEHIVREYRDGDLEGAVLAVAATNSREVNRAVGLEAGCRGIPVSVADCPEECSFFFPAVCEGAGLTAGIVSAGGEHEKTARAAGAVRALLSGLEDSV